MMSTENKINDIVDHITEYLDARRDLLMLRVSEKAGPTINIMVLGIISAILGFIILITLTIGTSVLLGRWFDSLALGFFATAGIWVILLFVSIFIVKRLIRNNIYHFIQKLTEN